MKRPVEIKPFITLAYWKLVRKLHFSFVPVVRKTDRDESLYNYVVNYTKRILHRGSWRKMRRKLTSLNFRLSIWKKQARWLRHSIQYCQLEALYFLPLLLSRKRLLERLDSPSGVFDQSFALDDNGTDIHCAKVQRESARYIADRPGRDFEKPPSIWSNDVFECSQRDVSPCNKARLLTSATFSSHVHNASRSRINRTFVTATHVFDRPSVHLLMIQI